MTVRELIATLYEMDLDSEVFFCDLTENPDISVSVDFVDTDDDGDVVLS